MQDYATCEKHLEGIEVRNYIALMVKVCILLFERKDYIITHSIAFSRNRQLCGLFLQPKSWVLSLFPHHHSHRTWSVVCIFHTVKTSYLTEVSVTEMPASDMVLQEFLEIDMHTVDTRYSFFPSHFFAPGNEVTADHNSKADYSQVVEWIITIHRGWDGFKQKPCRNNSHTWQGSFKCET